MMMLISTRTTYTSIFETLSKSLHFGWSAYD
eukprot:UN02070